MMNRTLCTLAALLAAVSSFEVASAQRVEPTQAEVSAALSAVQDRVGRCGGGTVTTAIRFDGPTGQANSAVVNGRQPHAVKRCVEQLLRTMSVRPFSRSNFVVRRQFRLRGDEVHSAAETARPTTPMARRPAPQATGTPSARPSRPSTMTPSRAAPVASRPARPNPGVSPATQVRPGANEPSEVTLRALIARAARRMSQTCARGNTVGIHLRFRGHDGSIRQITTPGRVSRRMSRCVARSFRGLSVPPFANREFTARFRVRISRNPAILPPEGQVATPTPAPARVPGAAATTTRTTPPRAAPPAATRAVPTSVELRRAITDQRAQVERCGSRGVVKVQVTFDGATGAVVNSRASGRRVSRRLRACVAQAVRGARVEPFRARRATGEHTFGLTRR